MATCAVTGTIGDGASESEVKNTGGTVILTLTGDTWIAAGGGPAISETFTGTDDALGANWVEDAGDWDRVSDTAKAMTEGAEVIAHNTINISNVNQYAKFTYLSAAQDAANSIGVLFRVTNAASSAYVVDLASDTGNSRWLASWYKTDDLTTPSFANIIVGQAIAGAPVSGDSFGITITGTDTNTEVRIWKNPTGNSPTSATDWGGDTSPDLTLTTDPGANVVNTGTYVGIHAWIDGVGTDVSMDNFYAGAL